MAKRPSWKFFEKTTKSEFPLLTVTVPLSSRCVQMNIAPLAHGPCATFLLRINEKYIEGYVQYGQTSLLEYF